MTNVNVDKLTEVMQDKEFAAYVLSLDAPEAAQKAFADKGIEFTLEEIEAIGQGIRELTAADEFSEADLDDVTGGSIVLTAAGIWTAVKVIVAVGAAALSVYKWVKSW